MSRVCRRLREIPEALRRVEIAVARRRLAEAESDEERHRAHRRLGLLHEAKREWRVALWHHLEARERSFCGNCDAMLVERRGTAIARCRFHVGQVDAALDLLSENLGSWWQAEGLFCVYAARGGRRARARALIASYAERLGGRAAATWKRDMLTSLAIAEAVVESDAVEVVSLLEDALARDRFFLGPFRWYWLAPLMSEFEEGVEEVLGARIRSGSRAAIAVAAAIGGKGLLPAIEARLETEKDDHARIQLQRAESEISRRNRER